MSGESLIPESAWKLIGEDQGRHFKPMPTLYYAESICEEVGELRNLWAKAEWRNLPLDTSAFSEELADILVYVIAFHIYLGLGERHIAADPTEVNRLLDADMLRLGATHGATRHYCLRRRLRMVSNDIERVAFSQDAYLIEDSLARIVNWLYLIAGEFEIDLQAATVAKVSKNRVRLESGHFGDLSRSIES